MKNGDLFQHYAVTATAWTNGSPDANLRFIGVESEGVVGEPLTEPQVANLRRIAEDCKAYFGWPTLSRGEQLLEHREMVRYGSDPTACPSGRIPWDRLLADFEEELTMAQYDKIMAHLALIEEALMGNRVVTLPDGTTQEWRNAVQMITENQAKLNEIDAKLSALPGGDDTGAHTHGHNL